MPLSEMRPAIGRDQALRALALDKYLAVLEWLIPESQRAAIFENLLKRTNENPQQAIEDCFFDTVCKNNVICLRRNWRFHDVASLKVMFNEIFLREEYFIPDRDRGDMIVLDFGANIGLTALYFKYKYPNSKIIGFEPNPEIFKILKSNIENSGYANVEVQCAAVGAESGAAGFLFSPDASMAGRLEGQGVAPASFERAQTRVISIQEILEPHAQVALLKMDIEGAEADVLAAAGPLLRRCRFIFVECHPAPQMSGANTLTAVLQALGAQGFKCHVGRSAWSERDHSFRPLRHAHQNYSACVYAVREV